jgi:hypothetical protein
MNDKYYSKIGEHPLIGKRIRLSFTSDPPLLIEFQ